MSHNIEHYDYKENINKKAVQANLSTYVSHATWQEGGHGLEPIRWNDTVCKNRNEAEKWIEAHDKGCYDQLAVKYYEPLPLNNEKVKEFDRKIQETFNEYAKRNNIVIPPHVLP